MRGPRDNPLLLPGIYQPVLMSEAPMHQPGNWVPVLMIAIEHAQHDGRGYVILSPEDAAGIVRTLKAQEAEIARLRELTPAKFALREG